MTYTRFDRHENMSGATRSEILSLIKKVSYSEKIEDDLSFNIQNRLYGLFDGYLYTDLQLLALQLPTDLGASVIKMYDICNRYPKIETA
jgi:hypothetical protein